MSHLISNGGTTKGRFEMENGTGEFQATGVVENVTLMVAHKCKVARRKTCNRFCTYYRRCKDAGVLRSDTFRYDKV